MRFQIPGLDAPVLYKLILSHHGDKKDKFLLKHPWVLLAIEQILVILVFHFKSFVSLLRRGMICFQHFTVQYHQG